MKNMQHVEPNTDERKVEKYHDDTNTRKVTTELRRVKQLLKKDIALSRLEHNTHWQKWQGQKYFVGQQVE